MSKVTSPVKDPHWTPALTKQQAIWDSLRPVARKQLQSLLNRYALTRNYSLYKAQIERLLLHEQQRGGGKIVD